MLLAPCLCRLSAVYLAYEGDAQMALGSTPCFNYSFLGEWGLSTQNCGGLCHWLQTTINH